MLKDWDAFEKLPEIDQMLLLEALMSTALMMSHLGEWWIVERLVADPRCRKWAYDPGINRRMNEKPRLGYNALLSAIAEHSVQKDGFAN
jgi:hypothetical protein